jgi:O-antigen ligase
MKEKIKNKNDHPGNSGLNIFLLGLSGVTIYFHQFAFDPFNTHKLIILIITSAWVFGHLIYSYKEQGLFLNLKDKLHFYTTGFLLASMIFAFISTDVKIVGFIGDIQRRNGLLSYLALIVIFLYLSRTVSFRNINRIIVSSILICAVVAAYGYMQITGNDFVNWINPYNSMIGTTGNPNFASALLAVLGLICILTLRIKTFSKYIKVFAVLIFILSIYCIIQSQSRQGLLVVLFGLLFYSSAKLIFDPRKKLRILLVLPTALASFAILGMLQIGPLTDLLYKQSVSVRGFYWRAAYRMFENNPLFGVGLDRYGSYFKEFRDKEYLLRFGSEITSTNAHNVFLQHYATGGFFVGTAYITLMMVIFLKGVKLAKNTKGNEREILLVLLSAWIGFQAQSVISIDNLSLGIWGWVLSGAIVGLSVNGSVEMNSVNKAVPLAKNKINLIQPIVSIVVMVPILVISVQLHRLETNTYSLVSVSQIKSEQNKEIALDLSNRIFDNPFADPAYEMQAALILVDFDEIDLSHSKILELSKNDVRNTEYLQWLSMFEASKQNLNQATYYREKIALLDPYNFSNYLELIKLYQLIGNKNEAIRIKNLIQDWAPESFMSDPAVINL